MKRRVWLGLALVGGAALTAPVGAQESRIVPPPVSSGRSLPVEPGVKPNITQEKTVMPGDAPTTSSGIVVTGPASDVPAGSYMEGEYRPSFSERVSGLGRVITRPFDFDWFNDFAGPNTAMRSDIEDPYWVRFEVLGGWLKNAKTPPLLTTSSPQTSLGIIGNEGTTVLFGGDIDVKTRLGARMTAGFWLEPSQALGFELSYSVLPKRGASIEESSEGDPLLALPYFDVTTNQQSSFIISREIIPSLGLVNQVNGLVKMELNSFFQEGQFNAIYNVSRGNRSRFDWYWGYRFMNLNENFNNQFIKDEIVQDANVPPNNIVLKRQTSADSFNATNYFNGINWGFRSEWYKNCWSFNIGASLALGMNSTRVDISGVTNKRETTNPFAANPTYSNVDSTGGVYALSSNIGRYEKNYFSVVPEVQFGVGYFFWDDCRLYCNYNFLAMTNVVRPGDQIDNNINPNILDGNGGNPANPAFLNKTTTFWLQTLSIGLEFRY